MLRSIRIDRSTCCVLPRHQIQTKIVSVAASLLMTLSLAGMQWTGMLQLMHLQKDLCSLTPVSPVVSVPPFEMWHRAPKLVAATPLHPDVEELVV